MNVKHKSKPNPQLQKLAAGQALTTMKTVQFLCPMYPIPILSAFDYQILKISVACCYTEERNIKFFL